VRPEAFGVRRSPFGVRRSPFAVRRLAFGVWRLAVENRGNTRRAKAAEKILNFQSKEARWSVSALWQAIFIIGRHIDQRKIADCGLRN
jgi:hypothetical protein